MKRGKCIDDNKSLLMINLYRQAEPRSKGKTLVASNRSHTASMHLRTSTDKGVEEVRRGGAR